MNDGNTDKKSKRNKEVCKKKKIKFNGYKNCLFQNEIILKSQLRFKREAMYIPIMYIPKKLTKLH